jgi:hypothetical protein
MNKFDKIFGEATGDSTITEAKLNKVKVNLRFSDPDDAETFVDTFGGSLVQSRRDPKYVSGNLLVKDIKDLMSVIDELESDYGIKDVGLKN